MANIPGTNVSAPIVPFTTDDIYETHVDQYGQGGCVAFSTLAERDAHSAERVKLGMLASVVEDGTVYKLTQITPTRIWEEFVGGASTGGDACIPVNLSIANQTSTSLDIVPISCSSVTSVASFNGTNGDRPVAALVAGAGGIFYGTTSRGGANNFGAIYSFNPSSNVITVLASFNGTNGSEPKAALVTGAGGIFYGTTYTGGANSEGVIFSFNPSNNTITRLVSFSGADRKPSAELVAGAGGIYYGTTEQGTDPVTDFSDGSIFSFDPSNSTVTNRAVFNYDNGSSPRSPLVPGPGGIFYGTTYTGGTGNSGTIFSFNPTTDAITNLVNFSGANGSSPDAPLVAAGGGIFYGTTYLGGANSKGTIFSFNGTSVTTIASFNGANGQFPVAGLVAGTNGILYGTTEGGGLGDVGTVFSFDGASITSLAYFNSDSSDGDAPQASLVAGASGTFYGTASGGGTSNDGTVFSFNPGIAGSPVTISNGQDLVTTVSELSTVTGNRAFVTDANATTFASVVVGGGSNRVPVYKDGANWRIG